MEVSREKKVSLRHIYMEIGRKCNLKCRHCCKGESEDKEMSNEVMDALLDNVHFIDEITVTGGEPMLYIERIRTFLDKCRERKIRVNYFNVITNCTFRSEDFVELFNDWSDYCTFGNENEFIYSTDRFHKEYLVEHMPHVNIEANAEWYKGKLKECVFIDNGDSKDLDYNVSIMNEGRVRNWSKKELNEFAIVREVNRNITTRSSVLLRPECKGKENLCKYGCVLNCIRDSLYISIDGKVFADTFVSYELENNCSPICLGNICNEFIYDIVMRRNKQANESENVDYLQPYIILNYNRLIIMSKFELEMADRYCKFGAWDLAEECLNKYIVFMENAMSIQNEAIEVFNVFATEYEMDKEGASAEDILARMKKEIPDEYGIIIKAGVSLGKISEYMQKLLQESDKILKTFEIRRKKNLLGSIFVNPNKTINMYSSLLGKGITINILTEWFEI